MKHTLSRGMVLVAMLVAALSAFAATKTVTWSLPEDWAEGVDYPVVEGYRAIVGEGLEARSGVGEVAEPDLPYVRIRIAMPSNGAFGEVTSDVEWEPIDLGGALPLPIAKPVPTGSKLTYPAPGDAYQRVYPAKVAKTEFLQISSGVCMMPVVVTPFRWDGSTKTLYRAKSLKVTATFMVPDARLRLAAASASAGSANLTDFQKMALSMTINPDDGLGGLDSRLKLSASSARQSLATFGNDNEADYVIISPPRFVDLWTAFAQFRKMTDNGKDHTFCVTDTERIYEKYDNVDGDDALKIHRYIEELYALSQRKIKYVVLGATAKKYQYDRETMVPARYVVCGGSLSQLLDMYYGCMDRMPAGVGVEVWDYDGDGAYLGHKNANGSYSQDSNAYIDWQQDLAVFRFPLMEEVVESGVKLTAEQIMTNFINKVTYLESEDYPDRYSAIYTGSTGFSTATYGSVGRGEMYGLITDEREFFDQGLNIFSPEHPSWSSDSEYVPRDHGWEFLAYLRGNRDVRMNNSSYSTCSYADIYKTSGEFLDTVCHGWARAAVGAVSADGVFKSTGYYTIYNCAVPCDTGMYDYCPGGSYGITNCICVGEAPALAPQGGGLASINNTRYGWSATCATSYNNGDGNHSFRLSWLFMRALAGVKSWSEDRTYRPMNAGEALMWAHNMHGTPYASVAWGLSGVEVTGQGDPLARLSVQYERTWNPEGDSHDWSTNAANWSVEGKDDRQVFDVSRDVFLPLANKASETFFVSNSFTTAGFFVEQDANATLTLKGEGSFKSLRETVITNGNVRWEVAGGAGRDGIKFVGDKRGNLLLPGNAKRYFGESFSNVGTISVSGGNVVIDTPRNFNLNKSGLDISGKIDWSEIEFVAEKPEDVTEYNQLRSRTPGIFKANPEKHLRVVNSKLSLQTYNIGGSGAGNRDKPLLFATNSTIKVQANPLWKEEYFVRPTYLDNSTIIGDYDKFAFGPVTGNQQPATGYDLYVSGKCAISGDKPIKLNGTLRIHFLGEGAELEIANALCDGTKPGSVSFSGVGKVKISATQTFTCPLVIPSGVTLEGAIAKLSTGSIEIQGGATANFALIPLQAVDALTLDSGAVVNLPGETANGIYQVVDSSVTTLVDNGAAFYDVSTTPATEIVGDISEGYLLKTANVLFWKGISGTWNKTSDANWTNATGEARAYTDGVPLCFADEAGNVAVTLAADVAPGFMDFRNHISRYVFGGVNAISVNSLAIGTVVTFDVPLKLGNVLKVTGGRTEVNNIETPSVEVANGGTLRVKGEMTVPAQKIKRLKFSFAATKDSGNVAAVQELRLFNKNGFFRLPNNTVITDIAGQQVTIIGSSGEYGHTMTGHTGDEQLGALVDGKLGGNNKWWASQKNAPTWFEITFPNEVDAITGYDFYTADSAGRNPKAWSVYAAADGKEYALSATKSDVVDGTAHHWMIGNGTGDQALYPLINVNGFAEVKAGGTLVLDGELYANVSLEANAILSIEEKNCLTNKQPQLAKLTLPESGTVAIDLTDATPSIDPFPILVGYNLANEQLDKFVCSTEEGMLVIRDGDLYAATQSEKPPYRATVTTSKNWSGLDWYNADNQPFDWNTANRRPNGEVRLTIDGESTISVDVSGNIGRIVITGSAKGTFVKTGTGDFTPAAIDDSGHAGTLDWQLPTGSAAITAGADTCIRSGAEGKGLLTVNANKKVTLGDGVTFADRSIETNGWVRFEGKRDGLVLADWPDATYSFADGALTGSFHEKVKGGEAVKMDGYTIKSSLGDCVKLIGTDANYFARSLLNFDIEGGTVEIETNGDAAWFGRTATAGTNCATAFRQSGGVFRCLATGTGAGGGLLTGYDGGTSVGEEFCLDLTGGLFEIPNSYFNFGNPTIVTMSGDARLKAKGIVASMSPGTINLGTNSTDSVVMEVGSLGLNSGAANLTMYNGATIVGFEEGSFIEGGILLYPRTWRSADTMTIAAADGATLTLRNLLFAYYTPEGASSPLNGNELVLFNGESYGGTIVVDSASCLPKTWKLMGGAISFNGLRPVTGSTITAAPSNGGTMSFVLTDDEYESGMAIQLIKTSGWSNGYASEILRNIFKVKVYDNGELVDADGTLESSDGVVTYIPVGGASEYVYPLTATVDGDKNWTALTWTDRNGKSYKGDWQNVTAAQLVNKSGAYTVTMDASISLRSLNTQVSADRSLVIADNGSNKLTIQGRFDDSASAGTTKPQFSLGGGFQVFAGKGLQLDCTNSAEVDHGKLVIGGGCVATVFDGSWNGVVEMADSTSLIQYKQTGGEVYTVVPGAIGSSNPGKTEYYIPMAPSTGEAKFGSDTARAAAGTFEFKKEADITTPRFVTGVGNGTVQTFFQRSNITITGSQGADSDSPSMVFASDSGSETIYYLMGGNFICENAPIILGKGGTANVTFRSTPSTYKVKGITTCGNDNNSVFTITYNAVLDLGSDGIDIRSSIHRKNPKYHPLNLMGTIRSSENVLITVPDGIGIAVACFAPAANTSMTINAPIYPGFMYAGEFAITGEGCVDLNEPSTVSGDVTLTAGTLRLDRAGLLNAGKVVFNGGKMEVLLTLEQVRAKVGNTYTLYQTKDTVDNAKANTAVLVKETGNVVEGIWVKDGDKVNFTPTGSGTVSGATAASGPVAWTDIVWYDENGLVPPEAWDGVMGTVNLTNDYDSTVTIGKAITLSSLRLHNRGNLTINGPITVEQVDDSRSTGRTVIGDGGMFGSVKAGANTVLESSGSGTLTIESGKKATSKVAYQGNISIAGTGTYVYDYPVTLVDAFADNRQYAGGGTVAGGVSYTGSKTLRLVDGDYTYGGRFAIVTATTDISGDTTTVTVPTFVMGDYSNANSTFNMSGGMFEVTGSGTPTSTSASILLAHWSSTVNMNLKGGTFIATNAAVRLGWDGTANVNVGTGTTSATMRVKGVKSGSERNNAATFTLGTNGTLELGDFGLQALGSSATYNLNGGKVVAFENSQVKANSAINVNGSVTFAAENGKTLTVDADFGGDGTIVCGAEGKGGTVLFVNGKYADTTITGAFAMRMTTQQQSAGAAVSLCKTPNDTVLANVTVQLSDGFKAPGEVAIVDGNLIWTPPECTMPLRATVTNNVAWADLEWKDSSDPAIEIPKSYWSLLTNISVVVTVAEGGVLTMPPPSQKLPDDLSVEGVGTIAVENIWPTYGGLTNSAAWQGTLRITNKNGCSGQNFVYLGNSASIVEVDNVGGWFAQSDVTDQNPYGVVYPYTLKVVGSGLTINNGVPYKGFAFEKVTGDGPINFGNSGGDPRIRLVLKDVAAYTGTLTVLGKGGVSLGEPTARISDGTIVFYDGCVPSGKTWTAPNGVTVDGKLTMTPNAVKPFNCALTFNSGSTLNVTQTEAACESIPLTTGTLTLDLTNTTLTFQEVEATGEWTVAAGYVVKTVELTAEVGGFAMDERQNDKIIKAAGVADGYFTVGSPLHPVSFTTKAGETVDIKFQGDGRLELAGGLNATAAAVTLDASGLSGEDLAKCAVHGAPYSHWLVQGALSGTVGITGLPTMPFGYTVEKQVLEGYGARLIVTAPDYAMFEAISVDLRKTDALESTDVLSGLYPVARKHWGDLAVDNNAQVVVSNVTFKLGSSVSGWGLNNTPSDMIYKQYMDDNSSTRTISITGVPYAKYRILVYFSTDLANNNFRPMKVNDDWYAGELAQNVGTRTVKGRNDVWGHTGPDHNANNPAEGVNVLCTDVYSGDVTLSFTRNGGTGARATPCAIQVVKVGEFVDIKPRTLYAKSGTTEFTDETEVLDAEGATTTLNSFDTLVITNALTAKFNFTDVKLMEIRIDVPNETVAVNNGDGTGYYAFDGETVTIANGTLKLNCDNHGDANVRDTVFNLCEHGELINTGWFTFDGTVTINSDYDKEVLKNTGNLSSIKGAGKIAKGGGGTITLASKPQGQPIEVTAGVLNLPDDVTYTLGAISGPGTLNVPANAVIMMGTLANGTVISGSGTLVSSGSMPNASNASFQNPSEWTGTVWFRDVTLGGHSLNSYCNANSVLRFTGVKGWLRNDPANQGVPKLELVDDGDKLAFEVTDSSQNRAYTFDRLIGGGTLRFATKASSACVMVLGDVSEFTGKLLSTAGTGTTARPIFIGSSGTAGSSSMISVAANMTVKANCGWQAASVAFDVTLNVIGAEGDTLVSGIATEPTLNTAVTLIDPATGEPVAGKYHLAYDAENGAVKVAKGGGAVPIAVNVTWGNLGSAEKGVVTNSDGKFGYSPWTVNFSVDDNIVSGLPSKYGFVTIKSLKLMKRSDGVNVPTSVTLRQGDSSVTSGAPATESNVKAYNTNGDVAVTRDAAVFTFGSAVKFDASKNVSLILNGANGSSVMRPANSVMGYTASGKTWSPLLEFTCDEYAARVEPVYLLNYYHADGQQQAGWLNYTQTSGASIPAQTTNDVSFAVSYNNGNFKQSVTKACEGGFSTGTYVDIHGKAHASLLEEVRASAGVDVSRVLKTGLANGAGGGATAALSGLAPNQRYVVYFGFGVHGPDDPVSGFTLLANGCGALDSLDYVVTGAGTGTQVATRYTAFTAGTNVRTANNAMMLVRAVLTPTSDGKVNVDLSAGRSALSFVVVSKVSREMTEYAAEVDEDTNFDDIVWTPEKPVGGFGVDDALTIAASGNPTITFTNDYTTAAQLAVEGAMKFAADDELYDDPILVHKTIAAFGKITATEADFAALKSGYKGNYTLTAKSIELHAQTKEIISLNIAGGGNGTGTSPEAHKVAGTAFAGLVPVQGNTWVNQTDTWGGGNAIKSFPAIVATDDGVTTVSKSGISATCAAYNTYLWNTSTDAFLKGYLDDGGNHAQITVTGIPYPAYDVIVYCATDQGSRAFRAVTVNGTQYTYDGDNPMAAKAGTANWGACHGLTAVYGTNAIRVRDQTCSTLTIAGGSNGDGARGGIAAIQIIQKTAIVDPSQTGGVIPAESTNDVKIVCTWTNDVGEAAKLDLTPAYALEKVEGGVKATLNPAGSVEVGEETIQVTPELTDADDPQEPLVVGEDVAVGVKSIPGLTYELMRGAKPGEYAEDPIVRERAKGLRTVLVDDNKPADKAFYIIRIGK